MPALVESTKASARSSTIKIILGLKDGFRVTLYIIPVFLELTKCCFYDTMCMFKTSRALRYLAALPPHTHEMPASAGNNCYEKNYYTTNSTIKSYNDASTTRQVGLQTDQ